MSDQDSGSFLTGFSLGLFAGAAGYFLFATDRGQQVRQDLQAEWAAAHERLVDEGFLTGQEAAQAKAKAGQAAEAAVQPILNLKQTLSKMINNLIEVESDQKSSKAPAKSTKTTASSKKSDKKPGRRGRPKKFKNT